MQKMQKALALILVLLMTVSALWGCRNNSGDNADTNGASDTGETSAAGGNTQANTDSVAESETESNTDSTENNSEATQLAIGGDAVMIPQPVSADYYQGKKFVFIGDSITCGVGATAEENRYVNQLAAMLGLGSFNNSGRSGNVMCTGSKRSCNLHTLSEENCRGADVVTILMGINDFNCSIKDGMFMLQQTELAGDVHTMGEFLCDDTTTVYGAVKAWCERVVALQKTQACKNTKFFFITPSPSLWNYSVHSRQVLDQNAVNSNGWRLRDLCEAIIETCDYYKIPVLDLHRYCGIYHKNDSDTTIRGFLKDGAHPNDAGHKQIAETLYQFLLMNPTYVPKEEATTTDYIAPAFKDKLVANPAPEVTYDTNGIGEPVASVTGYRLPQTLPAPTADGYTFDGWYTDEELTNGAKANDVICSDIVLYAKWAKNN